MDNKANNINSVLDNERTTSGKIGFGIIQFERENDKTI